MAFSFIMKALGILIGQIIAASTGPTLGFRAPFAIVAGPTLLIAPLFKFTTKEPIKGGQEKIIRQIVTDATGKTTLQSGVYNEKMNLAKFKILIRSKSVVLGWLQGIPGCLPYAVLFSFFPDFLHNEIGSQLSTGISVEETSLVVLAFGAGTIIGFIIAGFMVDYLWKKRYELVPLYMGITTIIAAFPFFAVLNGPAQGIGYYAAVIFPTAIVLAQGGIAVNTILMNIALPETRGTLAAIGNLFGDLGNAIGPVGVGALIVSFNENRQKAFSVAVCFWFLCAFLMLLITCFVRKDVETVQAEQKRVLQLNGMVLPEDVEAKNVDEMRQKQEEQRSKKKVSDDLSESSSDEDGDVETGGESNNKNIVVSDNPLFNER